MTSKKTPTIRKIAWISLVPQIGVMLLLFFFYNAIGINNPVIAFTVTYILLSVGLRTLIPRDHREGIDLVNQKKFATAIPRFEDSYRFFKKYEWVDKYRYITMMNSSAMSFREMALCNIAYCYTQLDNLKQAEKYYQRALNEFSESGLASAGIQYIETLQFQAKTDTK